MRSERRRERPRIESLEGRALLAAGAVQAFPLPTSPGSPAAIAAGPDGNLWVTENDANGFAAPRANAIARITPAGQVAEFPVPGGPAELRGIAAGPDGNLWFVEAATRANRVGRITPDGHIDTFPIPGVYDASKIAAGPDGNLWVTEFDRTDGPGPTRGLIARITPAGVVTQFPVPTGEASSLPGAIAAGPDGNLWFTDAGTDAIGRITPDGRVDEFPLPTPGAGPAGIAAGPDGNVWFTEAVGNRVGRITPAGQVAEFALPSTPSPVATGLAMGSSPGGIAAGPDGNLYVLENTAGPKVARVTTSGTLVEFPLPAGTANGLGGIAAGPDGKLWFTNGLDNTVARLDPAPPQGPIPVPPAPSASHDQGGPGPVVTPSQPTPPGQNTPSQPAPAGHKVGQRHHGAPTRTDTTTPALSARLQAIIRRVFAREHRHLPR